jgi:hypothetical protein
MKNAILLHGTKDSPEKYWFPWLKQNLEKNGYEVWTPNLPRADKPNREDWLTFILENGKFTEETIIVGHSAGAQIIPSILEKLNVKIKKAVLVAGYAKALRKNADSENSVDDFDWENIKSKAEEFIFINSDNDPWQCTDKQGRIFFDNLGGTQVVLHEGHMGSSYCNQSYTEFPLLLKLVL